MTGRCEDHDGDGRYATLLLTPRLRTSMDRVQFRFTQTENDLVAYNLLFIGQSTTHRRGLWIARLTLPAFAIIIAAYTLLLRPERLTETIIFSVLAVVWFLVLPSWRQANIRKLVTRLMHERSNAPILGEHVVTVDDQSIRCEYPAGTSEIRWASIIDLRENDRLLLLYMSSIHVLIFPKDRIDTAIIDQLRARARQVMGQPPAAG